MGAITILPKRKIEIELLKTLKDTLVALENQKKWTSPMESDDSGLAIATDRAILAVTNAITRICTEGGN